MALVFDIETIGENYDEFDTATKDALTHWIQKEANTDAEYEAKLAEIKDGLGFSPLTGEVVAIGTLDSETGRGGIYFQSPGAETESFEEDLPAPSGARQAGGIKYTPMSEADMLRHFWELAGHYSEFATFNGRAFDVPFLMIRSAIHGIRPSKDLIGPRYLYSQEKMGFAHYDMRELLSFYGTARFRGMNLHLWCRVFGIKSPKENGTTGDDVAGLFAAGKYEDIARYNRDDIVATKELYHRWRETLNIS